MIIDTIAKIMLLVFFGVMGILFIREIIRESKRSKIQFEKSQEFETMVVHHLGNISCHLSKIEDMLLYHESMTTQKLYDVNCVVGMRRISDLVHKLRLEMWGE